jgi:hypothetical protein
METRNVYIKKLEDDLVYCDTKLAEMKAKAIEAQADMKAEYLAQVDNLEKKREEFAVKYGQLKGAGEHAWDDVKSGAEQAWNDLESSIDKAIAHFK